MVMDNRQFSPSQSMNNMQAGQPMYQGAPGSMSNGVSVGAPGSMPGGVPGGRPMIQQVSAPVVPKKDIAGLVKTIVIIALSLLALTFIGLFIWMNGNYNEAQSDLDSKIEDAVAKAKDEQAAKDEAEFLNREKYPYKTFSGPEDYGHLTFEYPKTWSVYVADAAISGGDFNAYFNPNQVDTVSDDTINALRVSILNQSFDDVTAKYQKDMEKKDANLSMTSVTIGAEGNITANRYTGTIPGTELSGFIVTFKIRDKTAILRTDSTLFEADFDKLLGTVVFND